MSWQGCGKNGTSLAADGTITLENCCVVPQKVEHTHEPAIPLLAIHLR